MGWLLITHFGWFPSGCRSLVLTITVENAIVERTRNVKQMHAAPLSYDKRQTHHLDIGRANTAAIWVTVEMYPLTEGTTMSKKAEWQATDLCERAPSPTQSLGEDAQDGMRTQSSVVREALSEFLRKRGYIT